MSTGRIRLQAARLYARDLATRMPFRFGIATLTRVRHVFLRVTWDIGGESHEGTVGEHLFPKWFTKDPATSFEQETEQLLAVVRQAVAFARDLSAPDVFSFWHELYQRQLAWGEAQGLEPLLALFGTTLVERTLIEATARAQGLPFHDLLHRNLLGIDLGRIHPELAGLAPADLLPAQPLAQVHARHTVGLTDPLTAEEIPPGARTSDDLPQSLAACIAAYGLSHFKLKVCGDLERDLPRLRVISAVLAAAGTRNIAFSLDGNEQFATCADFHRFWQAIQADAGLSGFMRHCRFIEQPVARKAALADGMAEMRDWHDLPPVIIDESDASIDSLPRALTLGYAGTSHKNCKGVIRGVLNRCLLTHRQRAGVLPRAVMSGEDLVNIGPLALLQDLVVQAALGNASVERNGHHYFAGLSAFPPAMRAALLAAHPELYRPTHQGWPTLRITHGVLDLSGLNRAPFGAAFTLPLAGETELPL